MPKMISDERKYYLEKRKINIRLRITTTVIFLSIFLLVYLSGIPNVREVMVTIAFLLAKAFLLSVVWLLIYTILWIFFGVEYNPDYDEEEDEGLED